MKNYKIKINGEITQSFNFFTAALNYMTNCIEEDMQKLGENNNEYELIQQLNNHVDTIVKFPTKSNDSTNNMVHPFLQRIIEKGIYDREGYLHEINHNLHLLDELEKKKYTIIAGNNNVLDLIKYMDVTEYSLAYCPECKDVQQCIIEGCEGLISFKCDNCDEIIFEVFRNN